MNLDRTGRKGDEACVSKSFSGDVLKTGFLCLILLETIPSCYLRLNRVATLTIFIGSPAPYQFHTYIKSGKLPRQIRFQSCLKQENVPTLL